MAPMVAWSSARMEAVCKSLCYSVAEKGKTRTGGTHVVTRPDPAIPSRRFVAMRSSDILKAAPGRQTCRERQPNSVMCIRTEP